MDLLDIKTPAQLLDIGLRLMGWSCRRIKRAKVKGNKRRFRAHFGCSPVVLAQLYEDLQITPIAKARITREQIDVRDFLGTINFLKRYPTEIEREAIMDMSAKTIRKRTWMYLRAIRELKHAKITMPEFHKDEVWIMSVDGTHCLINEPIHPELSMDTKYYSHKKQRAGFVYELGMSLFESRLIWMNGPFKSGQNDNLIFAQHGLKATLNAMGKKALGDKIYNGHPDECATFNAFDSDEVKQFKSRVQMRHESFNGLLKQYDCIDQRFRHGVEDEKFACCFESVAVICQYRLENGEPLFDL